MRFRSRSKEVCGWLQSAVRLCVALQGAAAGRGRCITQKGAAGRCHDATRCVTLESIAAQASIGFCRALQDAALNPWLGPGLSPWLILLLIPALST